VIPASKIEEEEEEDDDDDAVGPKFETMGSNFLESTMNLLGGNADEEEAPSKAFGDEIEAMFNQKRQKVEGTCGKTYLGVPPKELTEEQEAERQ